MFEHASYLQRPICSLWIAGNFLSVRNMIVINSNKTAGPAFFLIIDFKLFNKH